ncbi:homeobox-leucine zipper protein HOX18-like [Phragmites australis]|uniref:homeobox-leucine zipper protein HOX18-like n=1 Tax=Phragmites australis TaxID=29695 RepID=UPI002D776621|nr:homeobox-leucine zipper protein HOX18-like [Phragmites australis]
MYRASGMEEEDFGAWLVLGTGNGCGGGAARRSHDERESSVQFGVLFPQSVKEERGRGHEGAVNKKAEKGGRKRLKIIDDGRSHGPSPSEDEDDGGDGGTRKKLRLTKEQSTLLEDTFRAHNILSHVRKQELAWQVNLTPRQVEVWFQNRRARAKLKQTEMDCALLKRCCEDLTDENHRLKHELMLLQRSATVAGLYVQFPRAAAMASICPSCEKVTVVSSGETSKSSSNSS